MFRIRPVIKQYMKKNFYDNPISKRYLSNKQPPRDDDSWKTILSTVAIVSIGQLAIAVILSGDPGGFARVIRRDIFG